MFCLGIDDTKPATRERVGRPLVAGFMILGVAFCGRIAAARGDLAMDEIWSLGFVEQFVRSIADVFSVRHDNNHLLNTAVMFGLGTDLPGVAYRVVPVLLSCLAAWFAGCLSDKALGSQGRCFAWIFVGGSYLLILYGSEARGYAYVVFFAYLSWFFLQRVEAASSWTDVLWYSICASLGFLSHLTFLYCFAGFGIWTLRKLQRQRSWPLLVAQIAPCATAVFLYLHFIRGMEIGGGPEAGLFSALVSTLSIIIGGGPQSGWGANLVATLVAAILLLAYLRVWRMDPTRAACYLTIIILAPAFVLLKTKHAYVYPRYFIVPVAFALLMVGDLAASWWRCGGVRRYGALLLAGSYLVGNGSWTLELFDHGRGSYSAAVVWLREHATSGEQQLVASDHDLRNRTVFEYFSRRSDAAAGAREATFKYVELERMPDTGVDWLILHNFNGDQPFRETVRDRFGNRYELKKVFRHQSLTGWNWWIYART